MDQKRFLLALVLSAAIIFVWQFFLVTPPPAPNTNEASHSPQTNSTPTPLPTATAQQTPANNAAAPQPISNVPSQKIVVNTPLYEVEFDNRGAVATSWIIKKIKGSNRELFSVGGTKESPQKLQLISARGQNQNPRDVPLRIVTGDAALDAALDSGNYQIIGINSADAQTRIDLKEGEQKQLEFTLRDESTGLSVTKTINFDANRYSVDLKIKVTRGEQIVPNVKLAIGPSIGDQGVPYYTFYSVAPEGVTVAGGKTERLYAATIHGEKSDRQIINGPIDWAGVGDTYFAMVAVPAKPTEGIEFRTSKYEHEAAGTKEDRFLLTGFLAVPADGSPTYLYVGPKDYYLLEGANAEISRAGGPTIDLEEMIDYGFLSTISRPLVVPILYSIRFLNSLTHSYGIAIIIFTIFIYSLFFPLKWRSSKAMKKAQKYAPRMKEIQEKLKGLKPNDPRQKELQMEQLRLMKEGNPLGGCLPLLIQMPFFFALFRAITISIDFRQASFLWLPDLSATDPIHLLPFLMAGSMLVVQLITPAPSADPLQRKLMAFMVPAVMLYALWSAPSGLLVYWFVGNIVLFAQQMLINRLTKSEDDAEPPQTSKLTLAQQKS